MDAITVLVARKPGRTATMETLVQLIPASHQPVAGTPELHATMETSVPPILASLPLDNVTMLQLLANPRTNVPTIPAMQQEEDVPTPISLPNVSPETNAS